MPEHRAAVARPPLRASPQPDGPAAVGGETRDARRRDRRGRDGAHCLPRLAAEDLAQTLNSDAPYAAENALFLRLIQVD
ncbi:MAG: hypothetical protein DI613_19050 [Kocuria rhizophila]|nr:MAG: hypothetical protein DI613_19050 [Kocuria rhizophila]